MGRRADSCIVTTAFAVVIALSVLAGCAEKGPVLLTGISYQAPEGATAGTMRTVVAVSPFRDQRGKAASTVGKRTIPDHIENDLVVQGTAADLVAAALRDALKSRGVPVKDVPADAAASAQNADLAVSGEITALWVEVVSKPFNVQTKANVKLRAFLAEGPERKVFRTVNLSSANERQDVAFSFDTVQDALSEALTAAINQLLADDEFKQRIR